MQHKNRSRHYRFDTKHLLSNKNKEYFEKAHFLVFMVHQSKPEDIEQNRLFENEYGKAIKKIKQHDRLHVYIYQIKPT